jgi:heavy metal translocating P-type ATPase
MLLESPDAENPVSFKETELFKKCQDMGIIPRVEGDLDLRAKTSASSQPNMDDSENAGGEVLSLTLKISHMWCPACAWVIEEALKKSRGIVDAFCNFSTDRVRCDYNPLMTSPSRIIHMINSLGYKGSIPGEEAESKEKRKEFIRFAVSAFLTMNVMMLSYALYSDFFTKLPQDTIYKLSWPIFFMASIVLFYGGQNMYQRAWTGISSAAFSMETLVTVGSFSAYLYSTINLLSGSVHLYYDTASMLITLVLLGKALERRAKGEVQADLENFFSLRPTKVRICSEHDPEGRYVAAEHLRQGDIFRVEEGEVLPADGLLVAGKGSVDESSLTGEALPIVKNTGDRVKSGARVIQGMFKVKAEGVGEGSTLGQMIMIVEKALGKRIPLEGKTDLALQWFVPTILILAAGTGVICLFSGLTLDKALIRAVTVMVIACPCTLGIAIPLARVAGISLAGRKGVLVRDFLSFEQAGRVNAFVLDKTGTVTTGKWSLQKIIPFEPHTEEQVLAAAASIEETSEHYIGTEIRREAEKGHLPSVKVQRLDVFENGISGQIGKDVVKIGSRAFLAKELEASSPFPKSMTPEDPERSYVFMSVGGRLCAIFVFGDKIREGSARTIRRLEVAGKRMFLVSGDGDKTTKDMAQKIGIEEAYGGKLPQDKVSFVDGLQKEGYRVAMVGDGINDAPALAQADLAIAVHSGSHLGKETADITLMRGDPQQILDFMGLAKRVNKKVYQNLVCSFFYNVIGIPLAMSGLLTPLIAVCAMLMSSLSVIGNTLLLIKRPPRSSREFEPQAHDANLHRQIAGRSRLNSLDKLEFSGGRSGHRSKA